MENLSILGENFNEEWIEVREIGNLRFESEKHHIEKIWTSKEVFSDTKFSSSILQKRMRELAFLNKGLSIILLDKSGKKEKEYKNKYDGGVQEFVDFLDKSKKILVNKNDLSLFKKQKWDPVECKQQLNLWKIHKGRTAIIILRKLICSKIVVIRIQPIQKDLAQLDFGKRD